MVTALDALTICRASAADLIATALDPAADLTPAERRALIALGFAVERLASSRAGVKSVGPAAAAQVREQFDALLNAGGQP